MQAQEKLFNLPPAEVSARSLDEQLHLLAKGVPGAEAREKQMGYALLLKEAGLCYADREPSRLIRRWRIEVWRDFRPIAVLPRRANRRVDGKRYSSHVLEKLGHLPSFPGQLSDIVKVLVLASAAAAEELSLIHIYAEHRWGFADAPHTRCHRGEERPFGRPETGKILRNFPNGDSASGNLSGCCGKESAQFALGRRVVFH